MFERTDNFYAPAQQRFSAAVFVKMEWSENIGMNGLSLEVHIFEQIFFRNHQS